MDKRIANTKRKLKETLLVLIKTTKIKDITVLELCKEAKINRTTFYKYYDDVDDLVLKMEEELIIDLSKHIEDIKRNYLISYTSKIIDIVANNQDIYVQLLGENGDHTFLKRILGSVYKPSIEEWEHLLKKASRNDLEKIYNFIVDGTIGIVEEWIRNNCQEEPKTISLFVNKICMSGLSSFI